MKTKKLSFELLRCIAIAFVLVNHRNTYVYFLQLNAWNIKYVISMVISILCKCACPIFFMISGAFLLGKDEPFVYICKHTIWRIISAMICFSLIYVVINHGDIATFGKLLWKESNWYLYAYLAFLVMLPFFRSMVRGMDKIKFRIFLILCAVFYATPLFFQSGIQGNLVLFCSPWASSSWHIVFPILGYYYSHWDDFGVDKREKIIHKIVLGIGTVASLVISCILLKNDIANNAGKNMEMIRQYAILMPTCLIFVMTNEMNEYLLKFPLKVEKILLIFSSASFGVFYWKSIRH